MDSKWRGAIPDYGGTASNDTNPDLIEPTDEKDSLVTWSAGMGHFAMPRHSSGANAGINVLFMDLSVDHVAIKKLWKLKWHREFDTNGYTVVEPSAKWPDWMARYKDE